MVLDISSRSKGSKAGYHVMAKTIDHDSANLNPDHFTAPTANVPSEFKLEPRTGTTRASKKALRKNKPSSQFLLKYNSLRIDRNE